MMETCSEEEDEDSMLQHDIRTLNKVVKSVTKKEEKKKESNQIVNRYGKHEPSNTKNWEQSFSVCDSLASEDVLFLHNLLNQDDANKDGHLLANFWTHELKPTSDTSTISDAAPEPAQNTEHEPPTVKFVGPQSELLSDTQVRCLAVKLPLKLQFSRWRLAYSLYTHGADIVSFYALTRGMNYTLIVIKTVFGEVFGGFTGSSYEQWKRHIDYYGSGESFVFSADHNSEGSVVVYPWTYENNLFMWSTNEQIAMGGGGDGFAFVLDADLFTGSSHSSATYRNKSFSSSATFDVANIEVWGFDSYF